MSYATAISIGHIHRYLKQPLLKNENGDITYDRLQQNLLETPRDALVYVCADLDQLPSQFRRPKKAALVEKLVQWVCLM